MKWGEGRAKSKEGAAVFEEDFFEGFRVSKVSGFHAGRSPETFETLKP